MPETTKDNLEERNLITEQMIEQGEPLKISKNLNKGDLEYLDWVRRRDNGKLLQMSGWHGEWEQ